MNRFRALAIGLAWAAACSTYGSEEDETAPPPGRDAGNDSSTPSDDASTLDADVGDAGDADPTKCDRSKKFGVPVAIPGLPFQDYEGSPRLTADELNIYWNRYADGQWALWTASRQQKDLPFTGALKLANVNDPDAGRDLDPSPTSDGKTLYFTSERLGSADIFSSTRATTSDPFPAGTRFDPASGSGSDRRPFVAVDGNSLWFDSSRSGASRIYRIALSSIGVGNAEIVDLGAKDNTEHDEFAVLSHDGLALYFAGIGREPETHVFMATRASTNAKFGTPARIDTWAGFSAPGWITADECRLYLAIGGQGAAGTRLAVAQRAK